MIEIVRNIIFNVLVALYQPFGVALIVTILLMVLYMYMEEYSLKDIVRRWVKNFKTNARFRHICVLNFYTFMILFRTLLNRNIWEHPLSDVIGIWGLYNSEGELTTEVLENLVLFVPFTVLLLWNFQKKIIGQSVKLFVTLRKSIEIVFLFSLMIEFLQLFLRIGTFQLSDLFYNTLGGLIGGLIYWCSYKITHRNKKEILQ